jgi:hypothetical protein
MSMIFNLREATDESIRELLASPQLTAEFLSGRTIAARFLPNRTREPSTQFPAERDEIDLDKSWHGIHYLLNGSEWEGNAPLDFIVTGGMPIGNEDMGYGPARAYHSVEVGRIAAALGGISNDALAARYRPQEMTAAGIYPQIWDDPEDDALEYLTVNFQKLKEFCQRAQARGRGMIVWMS